MACSIWYRSQLHRYRRWSPQGALTGAQRADWAPRGISHNPKIYIFCRPSIASESTALEAYSIWEPAGSPRARRVSSSLRPAS